MSVAIDEAVSFGDLGVPADLVAALAKAGITQPFDIQAATIPDAARRPRRVRPRADRLGQDHRVRRAADRPYRQGAEAPADRVVLAPTRELTAQICRELEPLAAARRLAACAPSTAVSATTASAGSSTAASTSWSRAPAAWPTCSARTRSISSRCRSWWSTRPTAWPTWASCPRCGASSTRRRRARQTMLFSATLDGAIQGAHPRLPAEAVRHDAGAPEPDGRGAHHVFWRVDGRSGPASPLSSFPPPGPTIVFCRTRRGADRLAAQLEKAGVRTAAIHGGRSQNQRDRALVNFKVDASRR